VAEAVCEAPGFSVEVDEDGDRLAQFVADSR
jgi:hypothetical protein